jgi:hypothetical protein
MTKPRSVAATANDNSIPGSRLENNSIPPSKLDGPIPGSLIEGQSITSNEIAPGAITSDKIASVLADDVNFRLNHYVAGEQDTVTLSVNERLSQVASVKDYGAVGDGVTDDTDAIRRALSRARSVFFPPGTYLVTSTINIGTQRCLMGQFPMSTFNQRGESRILARVSDIGDGNPIFQAAASGDTQSLTFANLSFRGDKAVTPSDLSIMDSSGLVGVNVRGVKQGTQFLNCSFRNLKSAVRDDIGSGNYLDKITFSKCFFTGLYLALKVNPTAGLSVDNCYFDECFDWIDSNYIYINQSRFNNSSLSSETCQIKGQLITANTVYFEGGNRWFRPSKFLSVTGSVFSEAFSQSGSTKFSSQVSDDGVFLEFKGCRIGTNTRLISFGGAVDLSTITVKLQGCFDGGNFANFASIAPYIDAGMKIEGYSNTQGAWNVSTLSTNYRIPNFGYSNLIQDKPTPAQNTTDWVLENGRHRRTLLYNSPGANNTTKTIILRSSRLNNPGAVVAVVTVLQLGNNSGYSSRRITQDRIVWLTEAEDRGGRTATVTRLLEEFQNNSGGTSQTSSTVVTATATVGVENICTIDVNAINTSLAAGKLMITVDVESVFD